jgi:polyhydroxyalkanoate synthase subunit PhaC
MLLTWPLHLTLQARPMTITDDNQNPKQGKPLARSLEKIAALRAVMEMRLAQAQKDKGTDESSFAPPPKPEPKPFTQPRQEKRSERVEQKTETREAPDPTDWTRNLFRIAERSQKLIEGFFSRNGMSNGIAPGVDPAHISTAFLELTNRILTDPEKFYEAQMSLWQGYAKIWQSVLKRMQGKKVDPVIAPAPGDKRFQDEAWENLWLFDYLKQSYLLTAGWVNGLVREEIEGLDPKLAHKIDFYTHQMVDAISPSNFWMTNPEVLRATFESGGENLVKGLENLLGDIERGNGQLRITMSDQKAFTVGDNLAVTKGKVIYENELMQLIQYAPLTEQVKKIPLLVIPPWINKFYILDLREKNSYIHYLVAQGYTVFCISWANPGAQQAAIDFEDYMELGALTAMREVKKACGEEEINMLGYCIGGTLLAMTLSYLKISPRENLPKPSSATYLVALTDFSEPGDIGVFIDEDQVSAIEKKMSDQGYLDAGAMNTTFNLLRANDLIWSFVINNYLLGKEPFPFDILYWNSDSTNLPAAMHSFYLRRLYMENKLVQPCGIAMKNTPIDLGNIDTPSFLLSTHDDHIAPWHSTYSATQIYKGPVRFVLAGSGHIAGIINPPAANKYGYWTNENLPAEPEKWFEGAEQHKGSWWPEWTKWLDQYSGENVPARAVKNGIEDAPGRYVKVRSI